MARRQRPVEVVSGRLEVAKKVARKSAEIAHELPSHEPGSQAPDAKYLQMWMNCREKKRAREDSNL